MSVIEPKSSYFERAQTEHRQLHELILRVQSLVEQASAPEADVQQWPQAVDALDGLLAHVKQHFAEEETGGYLEEAVSRLPRLGPQVTALERQHEPLRRQLSHLVEQARQTEASLELRGRVAQDSAHFVKALLTHEAAENRVLEAAFGREFT